MGAQLLPLFEVVVIWGKSQCPRHRRPTSLPLRQQHRRRWKGPTIFCRRSSARSFDATRTTRLNGDHGGEMRLSRRLRVINPSSYRWVFFSSFWCHRQRDECYNHTEIAKMVNAYTIPVLADRDEYPDIDRMFLAASQVMGATTGGWPLHVMLTPELKPFFCGHFMQKKAFFCMVRE